MLAPLPPASTCVDEGAKHAVEGVNQSWCVLNVNDTLIF